MGKMVEKYTILCLCLFSLLSRMPVSPPRHSILNKMPVLTSWYWILIKFHICHCMTIMNKVHKRAVRYKLRDLYVTSPLGYQLMSYSDILYIILDHIVVLWFMLYIIILDAHILIYTVGTMGMCSLNLLHMRMCLTHWQKQNMRILYEEIYELYDINLTSELVYAIPSLRDKRYTEPLVISRLVLNNVYYLIYIHCISYMSHLFMLPTHVCRHKVCGCCVWGQSKDLKFQIGRDSVFSKKRGNLNSNLNQISIYCISSIFKRQNKGRKIFEFTYEPD